MEYKTKNKFLDIVVPYLGECQYVYQFPNQYIARRAVRQLVTCSAHHGQHHFAVVGEGRTVAFSSTGKDCLIAAGILPKDDSDNHDG